MQWRGRKEVEGKCWIEEKISRIKTEINYRISTKVSQIIPINKGNRERERKGI